MKKQRCQFIKENKDQCDAWAMKESDFCYLHNPDIPDEEKREAQKRGGENKSIVIKEPLPEIEINSPEDVKMLLADTIMRVRSGEMNTKIAHCLGMLSGQYLKVVEVLELKDKLELFNRVMSKKE